MSEIEVTGQRGTLIDSAYVVHRKDAVESIAHCVDAVRAHWLAAALTERDLLRRQVEEKDRQVEALVRFVKQSECTCAPLNDDDPDGAKFGPSCERCSLLELGEGRRR